MIDQLLLKRTLNNNFTLKHISQHEMEKITHPNFILFLYWLDKNNIVIKDGYYRYSKDISITIYKEMGYNFYTGQNYPPLYFLQCFLNLSYRQSLYLLNYYHYKISKRVVETDFKATFNSNDVNIATLPKADLEYILKENILNSNDENIKKIAFRKLYGYLTQRNIKRFIIQNIVNHKWLMMDKNYNLCFITYEDVKDKNKVIAITKKGTYNNKIYKCNYTSDTHIGFLYLPEKTDKPTNLFVFESCLDLFSFLQLVWEKRITIPDNYIFISLNGAGNREYIYKVLNKYPSIENCFLCLDNDTVGIKSAETLHRLLITKNIDLRPILKDLTAQNNYSLIKDWNEALVLTDKINVDLAKYIE